VHCQSPSLSAPTSGRADAPITIENCSFVANEAEIGSSIWFRGWEYFILEIRNSIFACGLLSPAIDCDSGDAIISCTDICGNAGGDWVGGIAFLADANNNFSSEPLFCDPDSGDYHLYDISPCAPENNPCSTLIGALGQGCEWSCCGFYTGGYTGNTNCDEEGKLNLSDITAMITRVYIDPEVLLCCEENGDVNCDAKINLSDITNLITKVYIDPEFELCLCE